MTHFEGSTTALACPSCRAPLARDHLVSLEIDVLQRELAHALDLLSTLKPMLITASYYVDQHAHLLEAQLAGAEDEGAPLAARQAQARQLSGELMDGYCRSMELLALARR